MTWTRAVVPLAALAYVVAPGYDAAPLAGVPLGPAGAAVAAALVVAAVWFHTYGRPYRSRALVAVLVAAALCKMAVGVAAPTHGWRAAYHANTSLSGDPERSTDYPARVGTRIDRRLDFEGDSFPLHYVNELRFQYPHGDSQLYAREPLSVRWDGVVAPGPRPLRMAVEARGHVRVVAGGEVLLDETDDAGRGPRMVGVEREGAVPVTVIYVKPAGVSGRLSVRFVDADPVVTPWPVSPFWATLDPVMRASAWGLHLVFGLAVLWWMNAGRGASAAPLAARAQLAMAVLLAVQGWVAAWPLAGRVRDMSTGDDWFFFEAGARQLASGDWLQTFGHPLGAGTAFVVYPLYQYWLALVHLTVGESGFGPVFAQFLVLALANIVSFRLARSLFGGSIALATLVILVLVEQLAFVRYYTVTLFAENLYFLAAPAAVFALVRFAQAPGRLRLATAGVLAGVAAVTKTQMLLFLPASVVFVAAVAARRRRWNAAAFTVLLYAAAWLTPIVPVTVRNYIVSGHAVLITQGQASLAVIYGAPSGVDAAPYVEGLERGGESVVGAIGRLIRDHPLGVAEVAARKIAFSLGATNLHPGYRLHPELLLVSVGYLLALLVLPRARAVDAWPVHLFVAAHLAGMLMTLPTNYGYRLALPMYLLMPSFGITLAWRWFRIVRGPGPEAAGI